MKKRGPRSQRLEMRQVGVEVSNDRQARGRRYSGGGMGETKSESVNGTDSTKYPSLLWRIFDSYVLVFPIWWISSIVFTISWMIWILGECRYIELGSFFIWTFGVSETATIVLGFIFFRFWNRRLFTDGLTTIFGSGFPLMAIDYAIIQFGMQAAIFGFVVASDKFSTISDCKVLSALQYTLVW